jgi:glycosyltransferase involved in cell wall biosynthesis
LNNLTVHDVFFPKKNYSDSVKLKGVTIKSPELLKLIRGIIYKISPKFRIKKLARLIKHLKPDIIHSMETQGAGYLLLEAKKMFSGNFPPWIHSIWGSDIYLYGRLNEHKHRVKDVLSSCNYLICEGQRDIELAKNFISNRNIILISSGSGGFNLKKYSKFRQTKISSQRKMIMLKGYQGWSGRALVGLRALERCTDILKDYNIVIYSAASEVLIAAELFTISTKIPIIIIPRDSSHNEVLSYFGKSRISLGLSISDGLPNSLLEAMITGSFPIQSWTSHASEWIENGVNGMLVPPEDPEIIEEVIRISLNDDILINTASEINYRLVEEKLDEKILKPKAIDIYNKVAKEKGIANKEQ